MPNYEEELKVRCAENAELKHAYEKLFDENSKLGLQYEKLLKKNPTLIERLVFLKGRSKHTSIV